MRRLVGISRRSLPEFGAAWSGQVGGYADRQGIAVFAAG